MEISNPRCTVIAGMGDAERTGLDLAKNMFLTNDSKFTIQKKHLAKQTVAAMTVHRLTRSKAVISVPQKVNNMISYNDVRNQNMAWARMVAVDGRKAVLMFRS